LEKVLTILSYELYANMPIFEFYTDQVIEHRSIIYAQYPNKKLELDLFIPKSPVANPMPVVICMHGDGYMVNRRIWFEPFAQYLASKGMAAVTIDATVEPQNSQDLYDRYKELGVHVELKWVPDEDHGFYEGTDMAIEMASKFFLKIL